MNVEELVRRAVKTGNRLTVAESCTGGLLAKLITDVPGASSAFDAGFITYSNRAKTQLLNVPEQMINHYGAVSEEVAEAMAQGALYLSRADIAVSITGIAGPGSIGLKPEGMVCFGCAMMQETTSETQLFGSIGRDNVREKAVEYALQLFGRALEFP